MPIFDHMKSSIATSFSPLRWLLITFLAFSSHSHAVEINWGGAAGDINVDSKNVGLTDATFTFQLGTFSDGTSEFTPDANNTDFWGDNWIVLDTADYNQQAPPADNTGFFSSSWEVPNDDFLGYQAYIWVYNNQVGDATSEWVLITDLAGADEWTIPSSAGSQQNFPTPFRVSTATDVIFGGLNGVDGEGGRTVDPGNFALQTQTFIPVPETGTTLLFGLSLFSLILRRGRQSS